MFRRLVRERAQSTFQIAKMRKFKNQEEIQYLKLISEILSRGHLQHGRNGNVYNIIGATMRFSLENGTLPLITTKRVAWKTCLKELLWFISGHTDNKILQADDVKIWNGNASREYLDSRGLYNLDENAPYTNCSTNYRGHGVDQLQNIIDTLRNPVERFSRRIILSAWNPQQIDEMALPPCHVLSQFHVNQSKELSCTLYQRSGDIGLGVPFNIASYSFLTHLLGKHCGLKPKELVHFIADAHIYDDHAAPLKEQILRMPEQFPTMSINGTRENIEEYNMNDFQVCNYVCSPAISMEMRV